MKLSLACLGILTVMQLGEFDCADPWLTWEVDPCPVVSEADGTGESEQAQETEHTGPAEQDENDEDDGPEEDATPADLSGRWLGTYYRPAHDRYYRPSVRFVIEMRCRDGAIWGTVAEPNTFGDGSSDKLFADIRGTFVGRRLSFTKQYDGTAGVSHSLQYNGEYSPSTDSVAGTWFVSPSWYGRFEMHRVPESSAPR